MQDPSLEQFLTAVRGALAQGRYGDALSACRTPPPALAGRAEVIHLEAVSLAYFGRLDESEQVFRRAIELAPDRIDPRADLCRIFISTNRLADARAVFDELIARIGADDVGAHIGDLYVKLGDAPQGCDILLRLYEQGERSPVLLYGLAEGLILTEKFSEALDIAREAEQTLGATFDVLRLTGAAAHGANDAAAISRCTQMMANASPQIRGSLLESWVRLLEGARRFEIAARLLQGAFSWIGPAPAARVQCAALLMKADLVEEAKALLETLEATVRDPATRKDILANLAQYSQMLGDNDEAVARAEQLLQLDPKNLFALELLIDIDAKGNAPAALETLGAIDIGGLAPDQASRADFLTANCREATGDYAAAFDAYKSAHDRIKHQNAAHGQSYVREEQDYAVNWWIDEFSAAMLSENADGAPDGESYVFIVGMPRSGTSLTEQILASHPEVYGAGELLTMYSIYNQYIEARESREESVRETLAAGRDRWRALYRDRLPAAAAPYARVIDKLPYNFLHLGLMALLFPAARFIHVARDPVETCLAIFRRNLSDDTLYTHDLDTLAHYYAAYERVTDHWRATLGDRLLDMRYEDLVEDVEAQARAIVAHARLDWDPACLDFHATARAVRTLSVSQVRKPIYRDSLTRAQRYGAALDPLREALAKYRAK